MKKLISLLIAVVLLLSVSMAGGIAYAEDTRTIVDGLGREVEVPAKVERIVTLGNASRMATYLGLADKMVSVANGDQSKSLFMGIVVCFHLSDNVFS